MNHHVASLIIRRPTTCRGVGGLLHQSHQRYWLWSQEFVVSSTRHLPFRAKPSITTIDARRLTSLDSSKWNANRTASAAVLETDVVAPMILKPPTSKPNTVVRTVAATHSHTSTTATAAPTIPHPWIVAAALYPAFGESSSSSVSHNNHTALYKQAHRLLDELEQAATSTTSDTTQLLQPEQWMEVEDCLWTLSNSRNTESVDLTFLLMDKLLVARQKQLGVQSPRGSLVDDIDINVQQPGYDDEAYAKFLTNWELWHSILINWQQVCKEYLTPKTTMGGNSPHRRRNAPSLVTMDAQIVPPAKLLLMLDEWNSVLATFPVKTHHAHSDTSLPHFTCTTSKTFSLLIDVTGRRGRFMADNNNPHTARSPTSVVAPVGGGGDTLLAHAELGEALLWRMMDHVDSNVNSFPPSASNLNMILNLWSKLGNGDRAWQLLQRVEPMIRPDLLSYNTVMQAFAVTGNGVAAETVLAAMCCRPLPLSARGGGGGVEHDIPPDVTTWNIVLAAWARSEHKVAAAQRVEQMLVIMVKSGENVGRVNSAVVPVSRDNDDHDGTKHTSDEQKKLSASSPLQAIPQEYLLRTVIKPNLTTFNTALSAWARVGEAETCARLLGEMRELYEAGRLDDPPDSFSYATVLNAFAKAGEPDQAEALFDQMYAAYTQHGMTQLKPTIPILTSILDAYSRKLVDATAKKNDAVALDSVQRAQRIFQRMKDLNQAGFLPSGPDTPAYNVMLTCHLRSAAVSTFPRVNAAADMADKLLQEMKHMAAWNDSQAAPDFRTYSIVIQTWLLRPDGVQRAIQLLDEMWNSQVSPANLRLKPDSLSLHCIIVGFCRANQPEVAQKLLLKVCELKRDSPSLMIEPRPASFGSVLGALFRSKHPNAARIAHQLVAHIEKLHKKGVISRGPDIQMYRTLVNLWAYSDHSGSAKIALQIVLDLRKRALGGDKSMQPDLVTYNQVIFALSRGNGKADPFRAERLLRLIHEDYTKQICNVKPDVKSFNSVLTAWTRFNHPESADRAFELFQTMERLHHGGESVFDSVSCSVMLRALTRSSTRKSAERAESVLHSMTLLSNAGDKTFQPDATCYECVINAWLHARDPGRAADVLSDMSAKFASGGLHVQPQLRHFEEVAKALLASSESLLHEKYNSIMDTKNTIYPQHHAHHIAT